MSEKTIIQAINDYEREYCTLYYTERTTKTYRNGIDRFLDHLSSEKIKPDDPTSLLRVENFIAFPTYLLKIAIAKKSIGTYLAGVKSLFEWLVDNECIVKPDYDKSLRFQRAIRAAIKRGQAGEERFPKQGEDDLMVKAVYRMDYGSPIKERNIAIVLFLRSSGCRNAEMAALKVGDLNFKERSAHVIGKGDKPRSAFFDSNASGAIKDYWQVRGWAGQKDPAFARHDRKAEKQKIHGHISTVMVRNVVNEVSMLAGIDKGKFTPHYFRHAFAIRVLSETGNIALVQHLLGHSNPSSTGVYAKIREGELREEHHKIYK